MHSKKAGNHYNHLHASSTDLWAAQKPDNYRDFAKNETTPKETTPKETTPIKTISPEMKKDINSSLSSISDPVLRARLSNALKSGDPHDLNYALKDYINPITGKFDPSGISGSGSVASNVIKGLTDTYSYFFG